MKRVNVYMPVNIPPGLVANAQMLTLPVNGLSLNVCKMPPEGFRCISLDVPLQASGVGVSVWKIQQAPGSGGLSQLAAIYAQNPLNVIVTFLFPATGYQVDIAPGESKIFPVLESGVTGIPLFYCIINEASTDVTAIVKVFLLNQFLPEFTSDSVAPVIPVTDDSQGAIATQSGGGDFSMQIDIGPGTLRGVQVWVDITCNADCSLDAYIADSNASPNSGFIAVPIHGAVARQVIRLVELSGLNIAIGNAISLNIADPGNNIVLVRGGLSGQATLDI